MKKRKLKGFVLPTLYLLITISIFTGIILLGGDIVFSEDEYNYGTSALKENVESVLIEDEITTSVIESPVSNDNVEISIHFYKNDGDEVSQQNSLIYYENTYLPNTGVMYTSNDIFDVKSIHEGTVLEIIDDEFFSKCVVVEHTSNLRSYYYGIDEIEVQVGDILTPGAVIGVSRVNEIMNNKKSFLLEVYHNNELVNPEEVIGTKVTDYE